MRRSALILAVGAGVYALAIGVFGITFAATPFIIGVVALCAAVVGDRPPLTGAGLVLAGWGAAVLAVREGLLPGGRPAAAYLLGAGLGLVLTRVLHRLTGADLGDGAYALLAGGLGFYLTYEVAELSDWPIWSAVLLAWAVWETTGGGGQRSRRGSTR